MTAERKCLTCGAVLPDEPPDRDKCLVCDPTTARSFATTHWSVLIQAGNQGSSQATEALAWLCQAYWYPLYAYVRRQGHNVEDAQDLTQEFFARLLERRLYQRADPQRGRFRSFLLTSLKNFLTNEWKNGRREKRGGGQPIISLDADKSETRFRAEPADNWSPDKAFDRGWAGVLLDRVLEQLNGEFVAVGRGAVFDELKFALTGEENGSSYAEIARRLDLTAGNLKVTVHRLRRRYRELLREEIARTVDSPEAVEDEIRQLFAALGN